MNEQFDRALRNHIRDTFDHYDDLMADDGWEKFKNQKNRKKRGLIFWYGLPSGIAAALALLWLFNISTTELITPENKTIAQNEVSTLPQATVKNTENKGRNIAPIPNQNLSSSLNPVNNRPEPVLNREIEAYTVASNPTERPQLDLINAESKTFTAAINKPVQPILSISEPNTMVQSPLGIDNREYLAFNTALLKNTPDYPTNKVSETKETDKKKDSKFNFAVDANTYYSFTSAGVADDLNMGVGILSELKLSKRLSINSGIGINRQSAIYQNSQNASFEEYSSPASPNSFVSSVSKQSISVPEKTKTDARLVGFDIPINLKYSISRGKVKSFVSGGISSYSLLNQSYVNDVSVTNYSLKSEPTTTVLRNVDKENESAFSNFQFARTLNFSFGILYPVSTKNSISVEPFVKYPISGFGNQDLEIGSGGISFKLNFGK